MCVMQRPAKRQFIRNLLIDEQLVVILRIVIRLIFIESAVRLKAKLVVSAVTCFYAILRNTVPGLVGMFGTRKV